MADKELVSNLVYKTAVYYGKDLSPEQFDVYVEQLCEYDFAVLWDAIQRHMKTKIFFPRVAELIILENGEHISTQLRNETEYYRRLMSLSGQRAQAGTDPHKWAHLAEEYEKLFHESNAEACRKRAQAYQKQTVAA